MEHELGPDDVTEWDEEDHPGTVVDIPLGPGKGRSITNLENQKKALALKRAGASYQAIAEEVGYSSASNAARAVKRALDGEIKTEADQYRALQMMRSEQLLMVQWSGAMQGDNAAWDRALAAVKHIDGYVVGHGGGGGDLTVNINAGAGEQPQNVLVIQGDTDSYKAGLMAMAEDHGFTFDDDVVETLGVERPQVEDAIVVDPDDDF